MSTRSTPRTIYPRRAGRAAAVACASAVVCAGALAATGAPARATVPLFGASPAAPAIPGATPTTATTATAPGTTTASTTATAPGTTTSSTSPTTTPLPDTPQIAALQGRVAGLQRTLAAGRRRLSDMRFELAMAETRLRDLQRTEAAAERALSQQLVGTYEGTRPQLVGVIVSSTGFDDLLERLSFARLIARHDARNYVQTIADVRGARRTVAAAAVRVGTLAGRTRRLQAQVTAIGRRVTEARARLVGRALSTVRAQAGQTWSVASSQAITTLTNELASLRSASHGAQPTTEHGSASKPVARHAVAFPLPHSSVAPPATWSTGEGVDLAAPAGTPEYAICTGTVILHGIGGLGQWAPVLRCDRAIAGHHDVFYGGAGAGHLVPVGARVAAGQPIARVGSATVGLSSGSRLDIGFTDAAGTPLGGQATARMLRVLRAAHAR